jgi:hypothetical protein
MHTLNGQPEAKFGSAPMTNNLGKTRNHKPEKKHSEQAHPLDVEWRQSSVTRTMVSVDLK